MANIDYAMLTVGFSSFVLVAVAIGVALWGTFSIRSIKFNIETEVKREVEKFADEYCHKIIDEAIDDRVSSRNEARASDKHEEEKTRKEIGQ